MPHKSSRTTQRSCLFTNINKLFGCHVHYFSAPDKAKNHVIPILMKPGCLNFVIWHRLNIKLCSCKPQPGIIGYKLM